MKASHEFNLFIENYFKVELKHLQKRAEELKLLATTDFEKKFAENLYYAIDNAVDIANGG